MSAACDEEMFVREQRFVEADLLNFMDGIGEEQNQYHKENRIKIRVGSQSNTADRLSIEDLDKSGINRIVPDNSWRHSNETSRILYNDQSLRINNINRLAPSDNRLTPSPIYGWDGDNPGHFLNDRTLENIQEVSHDEEPQIVQGITAMYVD